MVSEKRSFRCRIGLHRWQNVTFQEQVFVAGRRCRDCGRTQHYWPILFRTWHDTRFTPNEDVDGYY